ncbi:MULTISPECIES: serine hydrolase [Streptomyces]|uniref:Beta-lactamase family protein n=2 Tax=Streptomyces rimosus subsp. rimosus TaxID=132474 RepID=A0A8A1UZI7_STRR1|nr:MULTISPECIES: serine hydrolase [Streptomyces]MYT47894.1 serine hydrolase [Streptomyces sp. SID5471]QDA02461.1 hypothetical protein CTZ40_00195 [Streptomyces rimosus]QEV73725.1 hypothetical protein CP984_00200 [Streptomyces rimosus]QGY69121.1 serine hydrolase [Streptomyces rimosus R6-500]QST86526.1 beta-lactamase family protein [Streptomyces rimosus subsp. rimosus ATCC 10970]
MPHAPRNEHSPGPRTAGGHHAADPLNGRPRRRIISTTSDMDTFLTSLASGELLHPAEWKEMTRTVATDDPGTRYGIGLKRVRLSCGRLAVGHTGGIPGYATLAFTTPDRSHRVVLSASLADWPADPRIGDPIDKILDDAICD